MYTKPVNKLENRIRTRKKLTNFLVAKFGLTKIQKIQSLQNITQLAMLQNAWIGSYLTKDILWTESLF